MKINYTLFLAGFLLIGVNACKDKKVPVVEMPDLTEVKKGTPKVIEPEVMYAEPSVRKVSVKKGEWLYDISRREYGNSQGWQKIYNANKDKIENPDLIYPNQEFIIPD